MTNKIPYSQFKHGQRCTCELNGKKVTDARIAIAENGMVGVCQDNKGLRQDKWFGYKYYYTFLDHAENYKEEAMHNLINLTLLPRTIEDVEEGDTIQHVSAGECKVLGICGEVVFISENGYFDTVDDNGGITKHDLKKYNWTIKQDTPPEEESVCSNHSSDPCNCVMGIKEENKCTNWERPELGVTCRNCGELRRNHPYLPAETIDEELLRLRAIEKIALRIKE